MGRKGEREVRQRTDVKKRPVKGVGERRYDV